MRHTFERSNVGRKVPGPFSRAIAAICAAYLALAPCAASAQSAVVATPLPNAKQTFVDSNGKPYSGGKVFSYVPNTSTAKTTWSDTGETNPNANPVVLDSAGRGTIFGQGNYRQVLQDANGNTVWDSFTTAVGSSSPSGATGTDTAPIGTLLPWAGATVPTNWVLSYGQTLSRALYPDLLTALTITDTSVACVSGSTTLSGWADTSQIRVGAPIEASCLGTGTTVAGISSSSTITVSSTATSTSTVSASVFPWGNGDGSLTFTLPDLRGRTVFGPDGMGGTLGQRLTRSTTINTTNGSATATVASATGLFGGMPVISANVPVGTTITSLSGTTVTLSANATATASGTAATFYAFAQSSVIGASGGSAGHQLTTVELPPYTPTGVVNLTNTFSGSADGTPLVASAGSAFAVPWRNASGSPGPGALFTGNVQGGTASGLSLVNPGVTANWIIKVKSNSSGAGGVVSIGGMFGDILCGASITCANNTIDVGGTIGAATFWGNPTASSASASAFTVNGLTQLVLPDPLNDYLVMWDHTAGTFKKVNANSISSSTVVGVASIGLMTGIINCGSNIICSANTVGLTSSLGGVTINTNGNTFTVDGQQIKYQTGWVNVLDPPYNAVCDGVTDDSASIQSALNTGKNVLIPAGKSCAIGANLTIATTGQVLAGQGESSKIIALSTAVNRAVCILHGSLYNTIRDFTMLGVATTEVEHVGIYVNAGANCVGSGATEAAHLVVSGMTFDGTLTGTNGWTNWIKTDGAYQAKILNNRGTSLIGVSSGFGYGVLLDGADVGGFYVSGNNFTTNVANAVRHFIYASNASNVIITNNILSNSQDTCIAGNQGHAGQSNDNWVVSNNTLTLCGQANVSNLVSTTVNGSTAVTVSSTTHLFAQYSVTGTGIAANTRIAAIVDLTHITLDTPATASGTNTLQYLNLGAGGAIDLGFQAPATIRGTDATITGNTIKSSGGKCIETYGLFRTIIANNVCDDFSMILSTQQGIVVGASGSSLNTTISNNIVRKGASDPNLTYIDVVSSDYPVITGNVCYGAGTTYLACIRLNATVPITSHASISGNIAIGTYTAECQNCTQGSSTAITGWGTGTLRVAADSWGDNTTITVGGSINMAGISTLTLSCAAACNITAFTNIVQNKMYTLCFTNGNNTIKTSSSYLIGGVDLTPAVASGKSCAIFIGDTTLLMRQVTAPQNSS